MNICEVNECLQAIKENCSSKEEDRRKSVVKHARILEIVLGSFNGPEPGGPESTVRQ